MNVPPVSVERVQKCVVNFEIYRFLKKAANLPHPPLPTVYRDDIITSERAQRAERVLSYLREKSEYSRPDPARSGPTPSRSLKPYISGTACLIDKRSSLMNTTWM